MTSFEPVVIANVGARAASGENHLQVAMLARAGLACSRRVDVGSGFVDVRHSPGASRDLRGNERLVVLAAKALAEAYACPWTDRSVLDAAARSSGRDAIAAELALPVPLVLLAPVEIDSRGDGRADERLIASLAQASAVPLDRPSSRVLRGDAGHFADALRASLDLLAGGRRAVLVGSVDAPADPDRLAPPSAKGSSRDVATRGDGAAFLLLVRGRPPHATALRALARVVATARRDAPDDPDEVDDDGEPRGTTAWLDAARRATELYPSIEWILSDVDGTTARARAWSAVRSKLARSASELRPIELLGDVGLAKGPLLVAIACSLWEVGAAPAASALVALGSDRGRSAILLEAVDPPPTSIAREPTRSMPAFVDRARSALERVRSLPRGEPGERVARELDGCWRALGRLSKTEPADPAQLEHLAEAVAHAVAARDIAAREPFEGAAGTSRDLAAIERVLAVGREALLARLVEADRRRDAGTPDASDRSFRASVGVPEVHDLPAAELAPFGALHAASAAFGDDEPSTSPPVARRDDPDLAPLARSALEEIGRLAWLRRPTEADAWSPARAQFEARMLASLDAVVLLGLSGEVDVPRAVLRYVGESLCDPARAFVCAFVLGCLAGDDGLRVARMICRRSHVCTMEAYKEGFSLASNPRAVAVAEEMCLDDDEHVVAMALEVLHSRGAARFAVIAPLVAHPSAVVRERAALAASSSPESAVVVDLFVPLVGSDPDDSLARGLVETLVVLDSRAGLEFARRRLATASRKSDPISLELRSFLIHVVSVVGAGSDVELLLRAASPSRLLAELGWLGHATALEPLVQALEAVGPDSADGAARAAIGSALQRITGALLDEAGVPRRRGIPHATLVDAKAWRAFLTSRGAALGTAERLRFGERFTMNATLDELVDYGVDASSRAACALELGAVVGPALVPWLGGWTSRQKALLAQARELLASRDGKRLHTDAQWIAAQTGHRRV